MKKYSFEVFLVFIFSFLLAPTCEAQLLDKLQKRAEERAQKRVEQKIEQRVDKTVDAPENAIKENKKTKKTKKANTKEDKSESSIDLSLLMNTSNDIKLSDSYEFSQKVTYVMKDASSNKTNEMTYWFSSNPQVFGIETTSIQNTFIVYDLRQNAMLMFSEKDKKVQIMPFGLFGAIYDNSSKDEDFTFKKTSETKKISGYNCQKYMMTSDTIEGEFWFSKDVDIKVADFSKAFLSMGKTSNQNIPEINPNETGFMIEMKTKDKSTNSTTQMTVKEILKVNKKVISSQYKKQ